MIAPMLFVWIKQKSFIAVPMEVLLLITLMLWHTVSIPISTITILWLTGELGKN